VKCLSPEVHNCTETTRRKFQQSFLDDQNSVPAVRNFRFPCLTEVQLHNIKDMMKQKEAAIKESLLVTEEDFDEAEYQQERECSSIEDGEIV
jgi:hypothetical protein